MRRLQLLVCGLVALQLAAAGCALVTPLDPIRQASGTCVGDACRDAGKPQAKPTPAASTAAPPARPPADADADAEMPLVPCIPPAGADCDPVAQCGCSPAQQCGLSQDGDRVTCIAKSPGTREEGEACAESSDCGNGLYCTVYRICARYCAADPDCRDKGKCVPSLNPGSRSPVPGSGTCTRWCDPLTGSGCKDSTGCFGASSEGQDPTASCRYLYRTTATKRGEPCAFYNECEPPMVCAGFGPHVCTSNCYTQADCPREAPYCYTDFVKPVSGADHRPLGHCVMWPCNESTLPPPSAWTEGPVWTSQQNLACRNRCGTGSYDCYRKNCADRERWGRCMDTVIAACAGAPGKPCRAQYVDMVCSDVDISSPLKSSFERCAEAQTDCTVLADSTCATPP